MERYVQQRGFQGTWLTLRGLTPHVILRAGDLLDLANDLDQFVHGGPEYITTGLPALIRPKLDLPEDVLDNIASFTRRLNNPAVAEFPLPQYRGLQPHENEDDDLTTLGLDSSWFTHRVPLLLLLEHQSRNHRCRCPGGCVHMFPFSYSPLSTMAV